MAEARRLWEAGERGPVWIQALEQTAGRGRRGRAWTGLEGNLFLTGLVTLETTPQAAANLSFACALAVAELADRFVDPQTVRLKWPNDVLLDGVKTSGILLESWAGPAPGLMALALGIGVNIAAAPEAAALDRPATCLREHLRPQAGLPDPRRAGAILVERLGHWIAVWQEQGFAPIRSAWLERAAGLHGPVTARLQDRDIHGTLRGMTDTGELLIEVDGGFTSRISAGDIFIHG